MTRVTDRRRSSHNLRSVAERCSSARLHRSARSGSSRSGTSDLRAVLDPTTYQPVTLTGVFVGRSSVRPAHSEAAVSGSGATTVRMVLGVTDGPARSDTRSPIPDPPASHQPIRPSTPAAAVRRHVSDPRRPGYDLFL